MASGFTAGLHGRIRLGAAATPRRASRLLRLIVFVFVVILVGVLFDQQVVGARKRQHLVGVGADRVIGDALEQCIPDLIGCSHGFLLLRVPATLEPCAAAVG